jgi:hypothetical protein
MILNSAQKLQIVLAGAITSSQLPLTAAWLDIDSSGNGTPGSTTSATNSTTAVDLITAPATNSYRQIKAVSIYNADTASATVTVRIDDGGTTRIRRKVVLSAGYTLEYDWGAGWRVMDNLGSIVTGITGPAGATGATGATGPTGPTGTTAGKHALPIMAGSMAPSATGGCATLASIASAANQPDLVSLDFDAATEEYAQFAIQMPKSWNEGTLTARFRWSHASTTTNFGVVWGIQAVAVSDGDAIATAYGTAQTVADTGGTTNTLYISAETSALTVAGTPQAGDTVFFRAYRKAADASDTLAVDARLHGVDVFFSTDADNDA